MAVIRRHGSLFSGIGGAELAAQWMGWENEFHCEINPFGRRVLEYYWPKSKSYEDITKTDFSIWRGKIDVLTGGFPCQPFSNAGKRKGEEDARHLWPEMLRAIREIKPKWVVGENVPGIVNQSNGLVFEMVQSDLESQGYKVQPLQFPALSVEANHERQRQWFIGYSYSHADHQTKLFQKENYKRVKNIIKERVFWQTNNLGSGLSNISKDKSKILSNCNCKLFQGELQQKQAQRKFDRCDCGVVSGVFREFPTQSPICPRDDGFSERLDAITFPKWRDETTKGAGNAIVPHAIYQIFKTIRDYENIIS